MKPIISGAELAELMAEQNLVIIDSSYPNGRELFLQEHIRSALFVDLDNDLADIQPDFKNGGRHPLPSASSFAQLLGHLGINKNSHVVVYDRNSGAFASRFWWMMRSLGHDKIQVLDGGFARAKDAGIKVESGFGENIEPTDYEASYWLWKVSDINDIEQALTSSNRKVVDVRGEARYKGEIEPIDKIAGHIPGAVNAPFMNNLNADGTFKSIEELQNQYNKLFGDLESSQSVFHCGSGVTACHSILALDYAGFKIPSLYVGSWSEWSRNNKPMDTNE